MNKNENLKIWKNKKMKNLENKKMNKNENLKIWKNKKMKNLENKK
jgi:hypothetical protein